MRDLIAALDRVCRSGLSCNRRRLLTDSMEIRRQLPTVTVVLDRIDELAYDYLVFHRGKLEGEPDYYNIELLKREGYDVRFYRRAEDDRCGEIITEKGRIQFG